MTTQRDDIAGLSERLRDHSEEYIGAELFGLVNEAATQLDSLQARVKELGESRDLYAEHSMKEEDCRKMWQSRALRAEQERNFWKSERDRIKAFLSEGDWQTVKSEQAWRNRALRAEQERDEAYERAAQAAMDHANTFPQSKTEYAVKSEQQAFLLKLAVCHNIAAAIRRLASGPEKEG